MPWLDPHLHPNDKHWEEVRAMLLPLEWSIKLYEHDTPKRTDIQQTKKYSGLSWVYFGKWTISLKSTVGFSWKYKKLIQKKLPRKRGFEETILGSAMVFCAGVPNPRESKKRHVNNICDLRFDSRKFMKKTKKHTDFSGKLLSVKTDWEWKFKDTLPSWKRSGRGRQATVTRFIMKDELPFEEWEFEKTLHGNVNIQDS